MRLIDADNAIHALGVFSDMEHGNKHFFFVINSAKEIINECVTIDALSVVRGEWKKDSDYPWLLNCSVCGYSTERGTNYCPNCGAKMEDRP